MELGKYISQILDNQGRQQNWLAQQLNISDSKLSYKLINNSISGEDLIKISKILNINLEKLKEEI